MNTHTHRGSWRKTDRQTDGQMDRPGCNKHSEDWSWAWLCLHEKDLEPGCSIHGTSVSPTSARVAVPRKWSSALNEMYPWPGFVQSKALSSPEGRDYLSFCKFLSRSHFTPQVRSEHEFRLLLAVSSEIVERKSVCDPFGPVYLSGKPGPCDSGSLHPSDLMPEKYVFCVPTRTI